MGYVRTKEKSQRRRPKGEEARGRAEEEEAEEALAVRAEGRAEGRPGCVIRIALRAWTISAASTESVVDWEEEEEEEEETVGRGRELPEGVLRLGSRGWMNLGGGPDRLLWMRGILKPERR